MSPDLLYLCSASRPRTLRTTKTSAVHRLLQCCCRTVVGTPDNIFDADGLGTPQGKILPRRQGE
eukprot:4802496-Pyramimonas_sp.AAC.1